MIHDSVTTTVTRHILDMGGKGAFKHEKHAYTDISFVFRGVLAGSNTSKAVSRAFYVSGKRERDALLLSWQYPVRGEMASEGKRGGREGELLVVKHM